MSDCIFPELTRLENGIGDILDAYTQETDMRFADIGTAAALCATPDRNYMAKSQTGVLTPKGREIGQLVIVAFESGTGTGAETDSLNTSNLKFDGYPQKPQVVPRSKAGIVSEVCIPLLDVEVSSSGNWIYARGHSGELDLVGLKDDPDGDKIVTKTGSLGAKNGLELPVKERPTYTLGHTLVGDRLVRFGDPHAVFCPVPGEGERKRIVVAGFWALTGEVYGEFGNVVEKILSPRMPF